MLLLVSEFRFAFKVVMFPADVCFGTVGYQSFGPIEKYDIFVILACVRRFGVASQVIERMHNTLIHMSKTGGTAGDNCHGAELSTRCGSVPYNMTGCINLCNYTPIQFRAWYRCS